MAEKKLSILVEIKDQASAILGGLGGKLDSLIAQGNVFNSLLAVAFGGAVAAGVGKLVEMFAAEEQTIVKLNAALRVSGQYSVEGTTAIQQMAQRMQEQTTTSRDQAIEISARFAALARNLTADQLAETQKMVIGYAAATGKSVEEATSLMVRAITTQVTHVRGLNVTFDAAADQQQRFTTLMGATEKLFVIATESAKTLGGQIEQAKNEFQDLERTMGEIIVKAFGLDEKAGSLRDKIKDLTGWLVQNSGEFIKWAHVLADAFEIAWEGLKNGVRVIADVTTILFNFGKMIGDALLLAGAWVQAKVVDLINWFIDKINDVVLLIPKSIRDKLDITPLGHVTNLAAEFVGDAKKNVQQDAAAMGKAFDDLATGSAGAFERMAAAWKKMQQDMASHPANVAAVSGVSTAGGGANIGTPGGEPEDPNLFAKKARTAAEEAKASFEAGITTFAQYQASLRAIRAEIEEHIKGIDHTSAAYLELVKVLGEVKKEQLFDSQIKNLEQDLPNAIATAALAHQNLGEEVKKTVGKQAAEYAKLDFGHAIEEVAAALAAIGSLNFSSAGSHFASAAQYAAAGAAMAAIGGASGGFSGGGGGGGGGASGAAAQTQAVAGMAQQQLTVNVPTMVTTDPRFVDWLVGTLEQAGGKRVTVIAQR